MATNNNGNLLDSSGNVFVDFVWGNLSKQPNDERADGTPTITTTVGGDQNVSWTYYSKIASARLNPALGDHSDMETEWSGFPAFTSNDAGEKLAGVAYIAVPSVVGLTTALALDALKDAGYEAANITTATITSTGAGAKYPVGTKITVADLVAPDTALNGTWTVTAVATDTVSFTTTTSGALSTTGLTVAGLTGVAGTIKTQSTAAGANSVLTTATITVTPYATAS